ncbi:hypothetical protein OFB58_25085, partial [Escherichia coli]|nr:hypothetical protein [Escherichia coli]
MLNRLGQALHIALALVQALACQWVNGMSGIAYQSDTLSNVGISVAHFQWERGNRALLNSDYGLRDRPRV